MFTFETRKSTDENPDKQKKFECPVTGCRLKAYNNLSRPSHRKDYHALGICPVDGCCEVVKMLTQ